MGKTFKRNQFRKPKQHGKVFDKKDKWNPKKYVPLEQEVLLEVEDRPN
jgi:hypothetical protein